MFLFYIETLQDLERFLLQAKEKYPTENELTVLAVYDFGEEFPIDDIFDMGVEIESYVDQDNCNILVSKFRESRVVWIDKKDLQILNLAFLRD